MQFRTQRELLEYLGKNPDDRHLVQRLIASWDVYKDGGMYVLNVQQKKKDLVDEVRELRERVAELEANKSVSVNTTVQVNNSDLEEAKVNAEYWEKECRRYWRLINNVISVCYRKLKGLLGTKFTMSEEEFKEAVIEEVKMSEENIN